MGRDDGQGGSAGSLARHSSNVPETPSQGGAGGGEAPSLRSYALRCPAAEPRLEKPPSRPPCGLNSCVTMPAHAQRVCELLWRSLAVSL